MAKRKRHYVEKDNYHNLIFTNCANILRRYTENVDNLKEIIKYLEDFSNIFTNSEFNLISTYNSDYRLERKSGVYQSTKALINDVREYLLFSNTQTNSFFKNTLDLLTSLLKPKGRHIYPKEEYRPLVERAEPSIPYLEGEYRDRGVETNFKNYYRIISAIVEDINNLEGWNRLRDYITSTTDVEELSKSKKTITFLSYAFKDNIYAYFLYELFSNNNGFLYVDSIFGKDYQGKGNEIKAALSPWINKSSQILFLHSIHSDRINKGLSSWCSWELGEAYHNEGNNKKKFYKVVVAGITNKHPIIDDDFLELDRVVDGVIIPKPYKGD